MRLADYVVSYSLQINNRCLRYLAECEMRGGLLAPADKECELSSDSHTVYAESLLARDSRRLASLWGLMEPAWSEQAKAFKQHIKALTKTSAQLAQTNSTRRLALRLANLAEADQVAQAMLKTARKLPVEPTLTWESLNDLFALDSHHWRNSSGFRHLDDQVPMQRIARSYRKGYRVAALQAAQGSEPWLDQHGQTLFKWVQLSSHQLELLRPGLSDKDKGQLWYLEKMADALRSRVGLLALREATIAVGAKKGTTKKGTTKIAVTHIEQHLAKMDKRIIRLTQGSFSAKPKAVVTSVEKAVMALGLRDISLMQAKVPNSSVPIGNVIG